MLVSGVRLRREFKEDMRRVKASVITMEPEDSHELERIAGSLSQFFGLPVLSLDEAAKKYGASLHISFDSSRRPRITFLYLKRMVEIGPRITISKLVWEVSS
jgi:hypothetical protein